MQDTADDSSQAAYTGLGHVGLARVLYDRNELQRTRLLAAGKPNQRIARIGAANRIKAAARAAISA